MTKEYTVVYVDDDPDDIELVTEAFENFASNVRVHTFFDGISALSYFNNMTVLDNLPCLIILDINMPRMNGKECLRKIKQIDSLKDVPIVLFTTSFSETDRLFAKQHNAGFVTKPLSAAQMDVIISQFIGHCTDDIRKLINR